MESILAISNEHSRTAVAAIEAMPSAGCMSLMVAFASIFKRVVHFFACWRVVHFSACWRVVFRDMPWGAEADTVYAVNWRDGSQR